MFDKLKLNHWIRRSDKAVYNALSELHERDLLKDPFHLSLANYLIKNGKLTARQLAAVRTNNQFEKYHRELVKIAEEKAEPELDLGLQKEIIKNMRYAGIEKVE